MKSKTAQQRNRGGFTLIEVVTSLSILSVLMLGLSGAVMIASHAIPTTVETGLSDQIVIDGLNQLRADLREASLVDIKSNATETKFKLEMTNAGASGSPAVIKYKYTVSTKIVERDVDSQGTHQIMSGVDVFAVSQTDDGTDVSVVYLLVSVQNTIQRFYEMHAILPDKPTLK